MGLKVKRASYGVDLSGERVAIVRAVAGRQGPSFETLCDEKVPVESGQVVALLATIESEVRQGAVTVVGAMPAQASVSRRLKAPFPSVAKAKKVLPALLDIQLPFALESCVYHFMDVMREGPHVSALAVAARKSAVRERIASFSELGVEPLHLDHEGLALWSRSVEELPLEPDILRVVAQVGHDSTTITVGRFGRFENAHACQVGMRDFAGGEADAQKAVGDFVNRTQRVIRAYLSDPVPRSVQWVWSGVGATDGRCTSALEGSLDFGVSTSFLSHKDPAFFCARALAVCGLSGRSRDCNFRAGDLVHPDARDREQSRRVRTALAYASLGLCLCVLNGIWLGVLQYRERRAQQQLTALAQSMDPLVTVQYGQEIRAAERALEQQQTLHEPFVNVFQPSLTKVINDVLTTARTGGMQLNTLTVRRDYVSLHGVSDHWADCDALVTALSRHGYLVDTPERQDAGADEKVHFTIKGNRG